MGDGMKKIVLAGGTGFVGQYLEQKFTDQGYQVVIISRQPGHLNWSNHTGIVNALEGDWFIGGGMLACAVIGLWSRAVRLLQERRRPRGPFPPTNKMAG